MSVGLSFGGIHKVLILRKLGTHEFHKVGVLESQSEMDAEMVYPMDDCTHSLWNVKEKIGGKGLSRGCGSEAAV